MIALPKSRSQLAYDLALTAVLAVFVAGMCLALVWVAPLELVSLRVH